MEFYLEIKKTLHFNSFNFIILHRCLDMIQFIKITHNFQLILKVFDNSHGRFSIWNISKIPQPNSPWEVSGNISENFSPFASLLLHDWRDTSKRAEGFSAQRRWQAKHEKEDKKRFQIMAAGWTSQKSRLSSFHFNKAQISTESYTSGYPVYFAQNNNRRKALVQENQKGTNLQSLGWVWVWVLPPYMSCSAVVGYTLLEIIHGQ